MYQQQFMQGGIGGLGGGLDRAFNPVKQMLSNSIAQEQVEPFIEEVKQMAQERFDLGNGMSGGGQFTGGRPQLQFSSSMNPLARQRTLGFNQVGAPSMAGSTDPIKTYGEKMRMIKGNAFSASGMKDGGEVMESPITAGLGSFLTSNLDEFGRNGDTEMIHATREEVIMPKGMMEDPQIRETVRQAFERTGRDMAEYTVGSGEMNVNPFTGYEEAFDLIKGIKNIFKKVAPIVLPAAVSFLFPGMSPLVSGALAGGVGSLLQGGDLKDALKGAAVGGLSSALIKGIASNDLKAGFRSPAEFSAKPQIPANLADKSASVKDFFMKPGTQGVSYADAVEMVKTAQPNLDPSALSEAASKLVTPGTPSSLNLGKAIPAGLGIMALAGGFDPIEEEPVEDAYEYTTRELLDMYPDRYRSGPFIRPIRSSAYDDRDVIAFAAKGGEMNFPRRQGFISGPGTETSDDVPAMLSDGEFVMTARAVRGAGNGSRKEGVKKMYDMMRAFEGGAVA